MVSELMTVALAMALTGQSGVAAPNDWDQSYNIPTSLGLDALEPELTIDIDIAPLWTTEFGGTANDPAPDILAFQNEAELAAFDQRFDAGFDFGRLSRLATGLTLPGPFRIEAEVSYLQHNVDMSRAFSMKNQDLDDEDEGRLPDTPDARSVDVGAVVADGLGRVETKATFANGFMDLPWQRGALTSYLGAGVGIAEVDVDYRPGGVEVVNHSSTVLAYQVMVGADYAVGDHFDWTLSARYRGMSNHNMESNVLPAAFQVEGDGLITEFGLRRRF